MTGKIGASNGAPSSKARSLNGGEVVPERFAITAVTDITDVVLNCALVIP